MTRARSLLSTCLLLAGLLLAAAAGAQDLRPVAFPTCEPPISTCSFGPSEVGADGVLAPLILADSCPAGYACTCVPREPGLDDCDAQVCVRDAAPDLMCEERRREAQIAVHEVVERYDFCRVSSDCIWFDDNTRCGGTCGAFVNKKRARRAARRIDRIDAKYCDDFGIGGCPVLYPSCLVQVPACIDNRCVGIQRLPDPLPLPFETRPGEILELEPAR